MSKWRRQTEIIANVVLIICGSVFCIFLVKNFLLAKDKQAQPERADHPSLIGRSLSAVDIEWAKNKQTLVLVLQKGCHFCDESAPFYQRLTKEVSTKPKTQLVAVLPSGSAENKQYLEDKKVEISEIKQLSPRLLGVSGTPTLLLVDSSGVVLNEWLGKLSLEQEQSVIARLNQ